MVEELGALTDAFEEAGVDYALCGGLALAIYALPRAALDIDVLVERGAFDDARRVARRRGFTLDAPPVVAPNDAVEIRRLTKVDPASGESLMLDALLVTPTIRDAWEGRTTARWLRGTIRVVSPEGLIRLKQLRGSGQDADDIRHLRTILSAEERSP